jgi:hypothetical protein
LKSPNFFSNLDSPPRGGGHSSIGLLRYKINSTWLIAGGALTEFVRRSDGKILVKGETDWVFVDTKSGKPLAIPENVMNVFLKKQGKHQVSSSIKKSCA